jgi:hypothetical protein
LRSCLDAGSPACYSGAARGAYAANQSKVVTTYPVNSRGVQWSKASKEAETFSIARADIPELIAALASYLADFTQTELEKA